MAFGPDGALVIDDIEVSAESRLAAGQGLQVFVEGVATEEVDWRVQVGVSAGWSAAPDRTSLKLPSAMEAQPARALDLAVSPIDRGCPPQGLVLDLRFTDPTGFHYTVRERRYFALGEGGLEPISYDEYLANYEQVLNYVPGSFCFSSSWCNPGDVCMGYYCHTGDPHGENVDDLAYHIAEEAGGSSLHQWGADETLRSSPCIGDKDNTYPFTGGFRDD